MVRKLRSRKSMRRDTGRRKGENKAVMAGMTASTVMPRLPIIA
jgi:hypothetical protein